MTVGNLLQRMADDAGALRSVVRIVDVEMPHRNAAFVLTFDAGVYTVEPVSDDDTVKITVGAPVVDGTCQSTDCSLELPWRTITGKAIRWAWAMTNNQGYLDGVQIEFANPSDDEGVTVQWVAIASGLQVRTVHRSRP